MSEQSRQAFAAAVRAEPVDLATACLLVGAEVEPDLDVAAGLRALDELAGSVAAVAAGAGPAERSAALRQALGERAGFAGSGVDYADLRSSLLHQVLRRRRGLPILLAVVWVEVAHRSGLLAHPVGLPGHVVVGVGDPVGERVFVDPFAGGMAMSVDALRERVRDTAGVALLPSHLEPLTASNLLLRLLTNIRALSARARGDLEALRTQLWATELSLLLPRHPVVLRRERGELLVRLGRHAPGAQELEAYADVIAAVEPGAADESRRAARSARARLN